MPLEIRELVIRATVEEDSAAAAGETARPAASGGPAPGAAASDRARLIAECVEQVMEALRERKER